MHPATRVAKNRVQHEMNLCQLCLLVINAVTCISVITALQIQNGIVLKTGNKIAEVNRETGRRMGTQCTQRDVQEIRYST